MSLNRYAAKRDANEPEIVAALRKAGVVVWQLDRPFDLLCGHGGRLVGLEVKDGKNKLTDQQQTDLSICRRDGLPVYVVRSAEEAIEMVRGPH